MDHCVAHRLGQWVSVCSGSLSLLLTHIYTMMLTAPEKLSPLFLQNNSIIGRNVSVNLLNLSPQKNPRRVAFEGNPVNFLFLFFYLHMSPQEYVIVKSLQLLNINFLKHVSNIRMQHLT